jgi:DNA-binding transcriptional ArsR family regulator
MTVTGPRVLDLTDGRRRLSVEVLHGPAFEILAQLFVFISGADEADEYGVGAGWFERIRTEAGTELLERLDYFGCCGQVWAGLLGEAYETREPRTVDALVNHLKSMDPVDLRYRMLTMMHLADAGRGGLVRQAAAGDLEAFDALVDGDEDAGLRQLMAMDPEATKAMIVETLLEFDRRVFRGGDDLISILGRDAAEKQAMARTMSPERLVEAATNGVTFAMQPEVSGVVLIPSVATRPFVLITECGSLRMFLYGVPDEAMDADPSTPSPWLVGFYKALADERRLQILGILAEAPASFRDLTERLGVAKSTVHHHLRTLRRAGLIRVVVGEDKEYQLRTDAVPEAGRLLESYLSGSAAPAVQETEGTKS